MPTYEYECAACGHHFSRFQAMSDKPIRDCPECGEAVRRLIGTGAGVILGGRGREPGASNASMCPLESTGETCCGRSSPCGTPVCER